MTTPHLPCPLLRPLFLVCLILLANLLCPVTSFGAAETVIAWGDNTSGQTNVPSDLTNAVALAAGAAQSLAIRQDGTVSAWGGSSAALTNLPAGLSNVVQVAGGGTHSLALRADGSVAGWGDNFYPDTNSPTGQATPPAGLANATAIAAGWAHSVALRYDRTVISWGYNGSGQTNVPANLGPAMAVAAGDWFSAALRIDGTVVAWGTNNVGQTNVPAGLSNVVAIAARGSTMLALKQNGRVVAWGGGSLGQTNVPADLTNAVGIAAGSGFEVALRDDGRVTAWGDNSAGQIDGAAGLAQIVGLAAGGAHGVALLGDGSPRFTLQPRNQATFAGSNVTFAAKAAGDAPLSYQWFKDGLSLTNSTKLAGATTATLTLTNITTTNAGGYALVINNASGTVTSTVAALTILNPTVADAFNPGANGPVYSLAVQLDGRVLVGGLFTTLGGTNRSYLGRLNVDGSLDANFNPGASAPSSSGTVYSLAVQPDGKILAGGSFTTLGGQTRNYLGRLDAFGNLDTGFNPGANGTIYCLAVQADGKILVGGAFTTLSGTNRSYLGRLNTDGSLDTTFNPGANYYIYSLAVQADGKILMGGGFTTLGGQSRNCIGRLDADGGADTAFNPGAGSFVYSLAVQADGRILVGGGFTTLGGLARNHIGRLNADASLDTSFNPGADGSVNSLALQADGKSLVGGSFSSLGGRTRNCIGRLNADGSLDTSFNPGASSPVSSLALQKDGMILAGGYFTTLGGPNRNYLGRLNNTESATESLTFDGSTLTWLRGGTGPEVWCTAFDASTNGADWLSLGGGRIFGGWQQTGLSLPANTTIRARGWATGGEYNGSGWFLESSVGPPAISRQPANAANFTNTAMGLIVVAAGTPPLAYQWYKNGAPMVDGTNSVLAMQNSAVADAGSYQVVVTNGFGSVTSAVATVTMLSPVVVDSFNPGVANGNVLSLVVQADGKVLAGGSFTTLGGQTRNYLGRLNANGSLETSFNPGADAIVSSLAMQADGKIVVGGDFTQLGGQARTHLGRLNSDGTLDTTFNPGANNSVLSLAVQSDGKLLVGGYFTTLGGQARSYIGRLSADGSLDTNFNPGANNNIYSLAVQADGKILVGGYFTTLSGQTRYGLGRLNADGTLDTGFNPGAGNLNLTLASVYSLTVQADGKILVGGGFTTLGGQTRFGIGRLNVDGSLDTSFNPGVAGADSSVSLLAVQADGKILVGGSFFALGGQRSIFLGRLSAAGGFDITFAPGQADYGISSLAVQPDGRVLVGGYFSTLGGLTRNRIARLSNTEPATESLTFDSSAVTWLRGGTGPEVWRTTFEACTNGTDWISLGAGVHIPGGWQQMGLSLPSTATIRARGFATGGQYNGSGWFVESFFGAPAITAQPTNTASFTNTVTGFSVVTVGSPAFAYQWYKNGTRIADATNSAFTIPSATLGDGGGYQVIVSNSYGAVTSAVATLTFWDPPIPDSFDPGADSVVYALAVQADGGVVAGGLFHSLGGQTRNFLGRLSADGGLDPGFNPGADNTVYSSVVQPDGKILVGGDFTQLGGQARARLGRLNPDGSLDTSFNPGANARVNSLVLQADGRILVGGSFTNLAGATRNSIGRLNADGTADATFNPGSSGTVFSLAFEADGKILVAGGFTNLAGITRNNIGRLNADGSLDNAFNPGANTVVYALALQVDGKILAGGTFSQLGGQKRNYIGRLNADGTVDAALYPMGAVVRSLAVQADGRILVDGSFANGIARLNSDGTLDTLFKPASGSVYSLTLQGDGKILVGGGFSTLASQARHDIGRLNNTQPATESLSFDGSTVTWMRGGPGPEAWRTTFDACTNGTDWTSLGAGTRISGGWQQTGLALPASATIRARGFCTGGYGSGSGWFVETGLGTAAIGQQPASRTNNASTIARFVALGVGTPPLSYQWCKGGVPLSDAGNLSGAQAASLTLTNVLGADAGGYSVIISNSSGIVTSLIATLTVVDPAITTQPVSRTNSAGANVLFSAAAAGTTPLSYQWRRNGLSFAAATGTSLSLTNVQWADAGGYDLVVSNYYGMVTSVVAALTVNGPAILVNNGNFGLGPNGFRFDVGCMPGQTVVIQASTNLVGWLPVQTDVVTSAGIVGFTDGDAGTVPQRFYRAVLLP